MSTKKRWWVVTDIDGTLMDHNYDLSPALPTIQCLQNMGIPVIPCTSKTATEVRSLRDQIGLNDPYIVENGGAIYGTDSSSKEEWQIVLGKRFEDLRPILDQISQEIGYQLKALNDLSVEEIESLTGLTGVSISRALEREWSVPFLNPPSSDRERLLEIASNLDTTIYKGNRMSHLLGKGSHKGKAVIELKKFLGQPDVNIIGLGDSHNDLPLLEVADHSIVIPGHDGPNQFLIDGIQKGHFILAPAPHAEGWAGAIRNLISNFD